jgi:hypothetical protein
VMCRRKRSLACGYRLNRIKVPLWFVWDFFLIVMEKKPLYADADPDDTRLQPVPPPPITVVQADVNQYKGKPLL